ncbi:sulfotransferase [Pseudooceanicola sp.]|uniref:sulfotransferase n=1 Tax=Pseudooceanicola sp. TaxID=1914328 RepID=UPI002639CA4E|nr:sulfotransferase [Pseudooceanicola sp.]MDF1856726.1 hypothetical protein [Pseudooceanicola sp.]
MIPRVVIHAGFHKTGTSSIQAALKANHPRLAAHVQVLLKPQLTALLHAARGYSTWRDPLTLAKFTSRAETLVAGLSGLKQRPLILSAEELSGHMPGRAGIDDYSAAPELMADLTAAILRRFPRAEIRLVYSTRSAESWLRSAHWEHVKSSSLTDDLATFSARLAGAADLNAAAETVAARIAPLPVTCLPLERSDDPVAALLQQAGVDPALSATLTPAKHRNAARPDALDDLLEINRTIANRDQRRELKQARLRRKAPQT